MKRVIIYLLSIVMGLGIIGAGAAVAVYIWASKDLPSITKVDDYRLPLVTTVYDRDGGVIGYFCNEKRFLVNLEDMPKYLPLAFIAMEDKNFMTHDGVDFTAIVRAFYTNLRTGKTTAGASTITQQVVKRLLLSSEKSYERKIKEAILAYRLEKHLGKDQILYIYLNEIYLGNSSYGVEAAARTYFAKHVNELTLAECAVLAGLPQAPSRNNPFTMPEATKRRQEGVLGRMLEDKHITRAEYDEAIAQPLVYKSMPDPTFGLGAWYLEEVRRQLISFFSEENVRRLQLPIDLYGMDAVYDAGLHVYTSMDPFHQRNAEKSLRNGLYDNCKRQGWLGPLENIPPEGYDAFLKKQTFSPESLANAGWAKALVTSVTKQGAEVSLGESYKGFISIGTMGWARTPNPKISPEAAGRMTDAAKILAPGDVVYVSAVGAEGDANPVSLPADPENKKNPVPKYDPEAVAADKAIPVCLEQIPNLQGALASIEVQSGDLVALVGGYQFSPASQFNRATQAKRQPGSSFKPIVYSAALDKGFTAGTVLLDFPFVLMNEGQKPWKPSNFDHKFLGPIVLRTALAKSRNVCTVRVAQQVGMEAIVQRAHDLGIQGDIPAVLSVSLGSYEVTPLGMAEAYSAFANQGVYIKPRIISAVDDCWGHALVTFAPDRREAISPQNAFIMATLLKDVVNAGTATRAKVLGRPTAGKTGTSNDARDAWFIGFSPELITSVYVGYDDNSPIGRMETGGRAALPIFIEYRQVVDQKYEPTDFVKPEGITMASVDPSTGGLAGAGSQGALYLPFITGTEPHSSAGNPLQVKQDDVRSAEDLLKQNY